MSKVDDILLENLAALEHEQWAHWTEYMLNNLTPENVSRWRRQIETPYKDLSDMEKESDRAWARKVLEITAHYLSCGDIPRGHGSTAPIDHLKIDRGRHR